MYRILIRSVNVNVVSFNWHFGSAGNTPWETEDLQKALLEYYELLKNHSVNNLELIQMVPVAITVDVI